MQSVIYDTTTSLDASGVIHKTQWPLQFFVTSYASMHRLQSNGSSGSGAWLAISLSSVTMACNPDGSDWGFQAVNILANSTPALQSAALAASALGLSVSIEVRE